MDYTQSKQDSDLGQEYNTFIKIVTNTNISTFFKDLYLLNENLFLVDFDNKDYFYITDLKKKITCAY